MLVCIAIILFGTAIIYLSLTGSDCSTCWHRDWKKVRTARVGVAIVIVGCLLVCYQFAYWG